MSAKRRFVCLCALFFVGMTGRLTLGQDAVPLDQAIKDGKVGADITGIGGSTGDTILITVRRKVPEELRLTLTPGTVFKSVTGTVQNMAGASIKGERVGESSYRPTTEIVLADNDKHSYVIEAYCLDFHKGNPGPSDRFSIAPPDGQALKILQAGKAKGASIQVIQAAVWMDRDGATATQLKQRFPVGDRDIEAARGLLRDAKQAKPGTTSTSTAPATPCASPPLSAPRIPNLSPPPNIPTFANVTPIPNVPVIRDIPPRFNIPPPLNIPPNIPNIPTVPGIQRPLKVPKVPPLSQPVAAQQRETLEPKCRTWTDATRRYAVEAEFVDHEDGQVRLKKKDGSVIAVAIGKLSRIDQDRVRRVAGWRTAGGEASPQAQVVDTELTYSVVARNIDKHIGRRVAWVARQATYSISLDRKTGNQISTYVFIVADSRGRFFVDSPFVFSHSGSSRDTKRTAAAEKAGRDSRDDGTRLIIGTIAGSADLTFDREVGVKSTGKVPVLKDVLVDVPKR